MLKVAAAKNVRPVVQVMPSKSPCLHQRQSLTSCAVSKAGEAVEKVKNGDVRYRYVLKYV